MAPDLRQNVHEFRSVEAAPRSGLSCSAAMRLTGMAGATGRRELDRLRILVLGAVVIGSMYAGKLLQGGHEVLLWPAVRVWSTCKPTD